jgi:hypothetical protein
MSRLSMIRFGVAVTVIAAFTAITVVASQKTAATMLKAATTFVDSLTPEQKAKALFAFDGEERERWHFIPNEMFPRKGLMIKDMTEQQRQFAHDLLRSGLSARGYVKVTSIMELEDILKVTENNGGRFARNKEEYLFSIFGTPAAKGKWGWRVEGHHVSLRFTIVDGASTTNIASSPAFLGSNPAEIQDGEKKGFRVLADEEDAARALVMALPPALQRQAVVKAVAPGDILTMNKNDIAPLPDQGVLYSAMPSKQQELLTHLIDVYASNMETDVAAERMTRIKNAGMGRIRFAWLGETAKGKKHYYLVQGPTFLIEYDNTQNDGNHIHSVWRDFNGDFGRDILREHVKAVAH